MKKIGILVPSLSDGGAEKVAANLSIIYEELGYDVYIILYENKVSFEYNGKIIDLKIKKRKGIFKIFKDLEIYFKIKKIKKKYNFDMTISHLPKTDLFNVLTKRDEKVITTIHNNIEIDYPNYMKKLLPYIIKKSDLIASVSKVGENDLRKDYNAKNVKTIYNPQMLEKIAELAQEEVTEPLSDIFKGNTIINVGRLSNQKGQWHLIRAFSEVLKVNNDARLILVGRGELEGSLKDLIKKLNIEEKVAFTGFNKNPYKFLSKSDLYVSTSIHEGLPMTYIEAMSLGLPIISTDCISGPREIIAPDKFGEEINYKDNQKYGVLVSDFANSKSLNDIELNEEEKNLACRINDLLNDKELYLELSKKAKLRSKDFDYKNIKKVWKSELEQLLGDR